MSKTLNLVRKLPYKSYTRKMIGYLYAISHGAEWIYDTDVDNRPIFGGLDAFDFADELSGVRFERNHSDPIINRLFNPYLYFGRPDMWPRGFPLEYFSQHNHTDANFRLCEVQKRAAVQQGLVDMDPDVDAIFRLLHANPTKVSSEHFNRHAPPIILGQKTYSPWNSQNTLFHRNAFFTMFLPTTVSFRTTDIWRSYFSQKLLHLIDEYVAFYPVNAVQIRNAHNYLKDFEDEQEVYLKSGELLKFLDEWKCSQKSTANCAIELAEQFGKMEFWQEDDVDLVKEWIHDLISIGYAFPPLSKPSNYELPRSENTTDVNCRRMFLQLYNDKSTADNQTDDTRSIQKMENFQDFVELCDKTNVTGNSEFPPLQYPFNYIHINPREMNKGYNGYTCMIKAYELGLRNIKGYFAVADDAMLNFWQPINLDIVYHQWGTKNFAFGPGPWWPTSIGQAAMENVIKMVKDERNCSKTCQKTVEEYRQKVMLSIFFGYFNYQSGLAAEKKNYQRK
ncbi:hypothetical protein WR25_17882 isoform H [Diploscapter pachys]|uniref:Uncharacterized protein n=1 Tax=Diploscapter pachys TaxID=2018661 RepID=A0A2A2JSF9_9BILA|nr:hypothetical protein WR25_17882 isoform H [Diploscapter pachys]